MIGSIHSTLVTTEYPSFSLDLLLMITNVISAWLYLYTKAQPESSSDGQPWFGSIWTSRFKSRNILILSFLSDAFVTRFVRVDPRAESHLSSIPCPDEQGVTNRLGWSCCCVVQASIRKVSPFTQHQTPMFFFQAWPEALLLWCRHKAYFRARRLTRDLMDRSKTITSVSGHHRTW